MITPIRSRSRPVPPGKPAAASARAAVSRASQCAGSVASYTGAGIRKASRSNRQPSISPARGPGAATGLPSAVSNPARHRGGRRHPLVGGLEGGQVQAAGRHAPERPPAGQDGVQQGGRVVGVGEPAGQADHGDRVGSAGGPGSLSHGAAPAGPEGQPRPAAGNRRMARLSPRTQSFAGGSGGWPPGTAQLFPKTRFPRTTQFPLSPANGLFPPRANSGPRPYPGMRRVTDIVPGAGLPPAGQDDDRANQ